MSNEQEIADVPLDLEKILEALNATTAHGDDSGKLLDSFCSVF